MSVFYDLNKTPRNILNQAIVRAIVSENNGALFDPSDLSTLYQDAAGTIPVTAVEQPVGKMLDKSGNGYHATQSITASRPTLSARKNILLATETLATQSVTTLAATYTLSFTGTGSVTLSGTATGTLTGTGTDMVSLTFTPTKGTLTLTVSGSVTKAQLELGAVAGKYQRVTTATDYDTDERYFPKHLRFDGVDDYLVLPYMGLYANGSASVVAGVALSTSTYVQGLIEERGTNLTPPVYVPLRCVANNGNTDIFSRNDANIIIANGVASTSTITNNIKTIISSIDTGAEGRIYKNSTLSGSSSYTRSGVLSVDNTNIGCGLYVNGNTRVDFIKGNIYGLIITKSALTDSQRVACERHQGRKSGVQL